MTRGYGRVDVVVDPRADIIDVRVWAGRRCPGKIPNMLCPWGTPGHPGVPRQNRSYDAKLSPEKKQGCRDKCHFFQACTRLIKSSCLHQSRAGAGPCAGAGSGDGAGAGAGACPGACPVPVPVLVTVPEPALVPVPAPVPASLVGTSPTGRQCRPADPTGRQCRPAGRQRRPAHGPVRKSAAAPLPGPWAGKTVTPPWQKRDNLTT